MTKTKVPPKKARRTVRKGRKRGPKEFVLKITEDPAEALSRFLNPPKPPKN